MHQGARIRTPCGRPDRVGRDYRRHLRESRCHVQIYQATFQFCHRRAVLVTPADVDGQYRHYAPVICCVSVVYRLAKVFVGISKGNRTRVGRADEEVSEIRSRQFTSKPEGPTRILLKEFIELLLAKIAPDSNVM